MALPSFVSLVKSNSSAGTEHSHYTPKKGNPGHKGGGYNRNQSSQKKKAAVKQPGKIFNTGNPLPSIGLDRAGRKLNLLQGGAPKLMNDLKNVNLVSGASQGLNDPSVLLGKRGSPAPSNIPNRGLRSNPSGALSRDLVQNYLQKSPNAVRLQSPMNRSHGKDQGGRHPPGAVFDLGGGLGSAPMRNKILKTEGHPFENKGYSPLQGMGGKGLQRPGAFQNKVPGSGPNISPFMASHSNQRIFENQRLESNLRELPGSGGGHQSPQNFNLPPQTAPMSLPLIALFRRRAGHHSH